MIIIQGMKRHPILSRLATTSLQRSLAHAPVVVVTGARQSGKTTLVRELLGEKRDYITMDDFETLERSLQEPDVLLSRGVPITIDEIQRSPNLLLAIKRRIDEQRVPGQFILTGSANLSLMRSVSESLAGRAVYKTLGPMTPSEVAGKGGCGIWGSLFTDPAQWHGKECAVFDIKETLLRGGFPLAALCNDDQMRSEWFDGYVRTYLERDLQMLSAIDQLADFRRLLRMVALRSGKLMNQSELARDAGLTQPTAHRYLGLLEVSHLLVRLAAYGVNRTKRLIKSPRLFFADVGLACHLAGIHRRSELESSDMLGFLVENLVLQDLYAWRESERLQPEILYWRTASGYEVDFVIEHQGRLLPVEVKLSQRARLADTSGLKIFLAEYSESASYGVLLYNGTSVEQLTSQIWAIPLSMALGL